MSSVFLYSLRIADCGFRLHAGITDTFSEISILVKERFGWMMFNVAVRNRTLRPVHTMSGAVITVFTVRMSL